MFDRKAYMRKWQQENKDKVSANSKRYRESHKEETKKRIQEWKLNNSDKVKEIAKKSHKKFTETHDWNKYCAERKKARVQKLREQGIKNPWSVIQGGKPKYE